MENGAISDGQISASSEWFPNPADVRGRLNKSAWIAGHNNGDQWLQINLGRQTRVTGLATQGHNVYLVTKYNLQYSDYAVHFPYYLHIEAGQNKVK